MLTTKKENIMSENEKINPQIMEIEIGIREMRKIKIYPLSMADQLSLTNLISTSIAAHVAKEEGGDMAVVAFILELVKENIGRILTMVTDGGDEKLLENISNLQAAGIAEAVYEVNYGIVAKNFKSLFGKVMTLFPSERPLPQSVSDMDTDLMTSTESPSETEALPSDS